MGPLRHSVRENRQIAAPIIARPSSSTMAASNNGGRCQSHQLTPGSSVWRADSEMSRWLNTSRRIGSTHRLNFDEMDRVVEGFGGPEKYPRLGRIKARRCALRREKRFDAHSRGCSVSRIAIARLAVGGARTPLLSFVQLSSERPLGSRR